VQRNGVDDASDVRRLDHVTSASALSDGMVSGAPR
jgi:hypothetical protein